MEQARKNAIKKRLLIEREKMVICVYQYLMLRTNIEKIYLNNDINNLEVTSEKASSEIKKVVNDVVINETSYIEKASRHLKQNWSFSRLSFIEQAIILVSLAKNSLGEAKTITINEAINLTKKLCDGNEKTNIELECFCVEEDDNCIVCEKEANLISHANNQKPAHKFINGVLDRCLE